MRTNGILVLVMTGAIAFSVGCKKNTVDKTAFKSALNNYYSGRQDCVWAAPVKFPAQADASDDQQTKGFDALTDAGLLTRKAEEKKRFLIGSKQVTDYDISDQGRASWTADASQPGYGNFCYGHPEVSSIDGYTPSDDSDTRYNVTYHVGTSSLPAWASSAEMKTAFPKLAASSSGQQVATANLTRSNDGWLVQNVQGGPPPAATSNMP
jgi:hypothetical protein